MLSVPGPKYAAPTQRPYSGKQIWEISMAAVPQLEPRRTLSCCTWLVWTIQRGIYSGRVGLYDSEMGARHSSRHCCHARRFFTPVLTPSEHSSDILDSAAVFEMSLFPCAVTPANHEWPIPDNCELPSERGPTATTPFLVTSNSVFHVLSCRAEVRVIRANLVDMMVLQVASQQRYQQTSSNLTAKCRYSGGKEENMCECLRNYCPGAQTNFPVYLLAASVSWLPSSIITIFSSNSYPDTHRCGRQLSPHALLAIPLIIFLA
jgi:hypothetical protein